MFIRQTTTGNSASNQSYVTDRLVNSVRIGKKDRQIDAQAKARFEAELTQ